MSSNIEIPIVNAILCDKPNGTTCIIVKTNEQVNNIVGLLNHEGIKAKAIQSNEGFSLSDLCEIRDFLEQIEQGQSATVDADAWNDAKNYIRNKYSVSNNLDNVLRLIKDFENINSRNKYKADFRHFVVESKLEDFITQDSTILVSTIHQTKGRQFDNVYLALDEYFTMSDEEYRKIYVAITRAKTNLHIQYVGDYFDDIKCYGLKANENKENYEKPNRITLSLSHKDIALGYFAYHQREINSLRSGQVLNMDNEGCFVGKYHILKFSKSFMQKIQDLSDRGYTLSKATVNHIVYWYPKDMNKENQKENEIKIILPNLEFKKEMENDRT